MADLRFDLLGFGDADECALFGGFRLLAHTCRAIAPSESDMFGEKWNFGGEDC